MRSELENLTCNQYGKLSGYSACCRLHFDVRNKVIELLGDDRHDLLGRWMQFGADYFPPALWVYRHVPCLLHTVLTVLGLYRPQYAHCHKCDWEQLGQGPCGLCGELTKDIKPDGLKPRFMIKSRGRKP